MGHLINPISLRIGSFSDWEDIWFTRFLYYPEYFHTILKVKYFLLFFSNISFFENSGFIFSHSFLIKKYKLFFIKCFFYNGKLEQIVDDFFFQYWLFLNKSHTRHYLPKRIYKICGRRPVSNWFIYYLKIFLIFKFFTPFKFRYFSKIVDLISMIHQGKFLYIIDLLISSRVGLPTIKNFYIHCLVFISLYNYVQKIYILGSSILSCMFVKDFYILYYENSL